MAGNSTDFEESIAPVVQAMLADGVNLSDQEAVREWLVGAGFPVSGDGGLGDLDDFGDLGELGELDDLDVDLSFKELYDLPERLPPLRLPEDEELAAVARTSRLLGRARALAEWVGAGRPLTEEYELAATDCVDAARALGIKVPDAVEAVERMDDLPEFAHLWELTCGVELITLGEDQVAVGASMDAWPGGSDEDVLDVWATALAVVMTSLDLDADLYEGHELDFYGAGGFILMTLFLARSAGVPCAELTGMLQETVVPSPPGTHWEDWLRAHGDPALTLLGRLDELGAVLLDGEVVRLTPLAQWAMWSQLMDSDVEVPLLPPVEEMSAADLVAAAEAMTEEELTAEAEAWLALRGPREAARELLEVAATGEPADRMYATSVVTQLGSPVQAQWRQALDDHRLRPYAKLALALEPVLEDIAWLLTDVLAATSEVDGPEDIAAQLGDAVPVGQEQELFEVMWRLPHPSAGEVLTLLGAHHPDKQVAKAARKAAFKAASHQDSQS